MSVADPLGPCYPPSTFADSGTNSGLFIYILQYYVGLCFSTTHYPPHWLSHPFLFYFQTTKGKLLDIVHPLHRVTIKNSFRDVQQIIANGIVETTAKEQRCFWAAWTLWLACAFPTIDLYCLHQPTKVQIELLAAFATHVQYGRFLARKYQVCTKTVQVALCAVTKKFKLDGQQNPLVNSQEVYTQKIKQLLNRFRKFDPPPKRKLAILLAVPNWWSHHHYFLLFAKTRGIYLLPPRGQETNNSVQTLRCVPLGA